MFVCVCPFALVCYDISMTVFMLMARCELGNFDEHGLVFRCVHVFRLFATRHNTISNGIIVYICTYYLCIIYIVYMNVFIFVSLGGASGLLFGFGIAVVGCLELVSVRALCFSLEPIVVATEVTKIDYDEADQ